MNRGRLARVAALALIGYAVGSIQSTRIIHRALSDEPISEYVTFEWGTGNAIRFRSVSATTLEVSAGPAVGIAATLLDMSKAVVPVLALRRAFPGQNLDVLWATASFAGHVLPPQHRFNGGRGSSILLGTCLVYDPLSVPVSIVVGQVLGLYLLRNPMAANMGDLIITLPVYFAVRGRPELAAFAVAANAIRWAVSIPELRQLWHYHRTGEMRTREFHEAFERTHHGYIHKWLRERGLLHYDYMDDKPRAGATPSSRSPEPLHPASA